MKDKAESDHERDRQEAPAQRARLASTLEALDQRLRDLFDWRAQVRKRALPLGLAAAGAVLLIGGAIGMAVYRKRRRKQHLHRERWLALKRFWKHPERSG